MDVIVEVGLRNFGASAPPMLRIEEAETSPCILRLFYPREAEGSTGLLATKLATVVCFGT